MKNQEKIKKARIFQFLKIFFYEAFFFSIVLGLGILSAFKTKELLKIEEISIPSISFWRFFLYFLLATLFIFLVSFLGRRFRKGRETVFKFIFVFITAWGGLISLSLWLPDFFALILILILTLGWLKKPLIFLHNLAMILGIVGIGSILGLGFTPSAMIIILMVFSVYDYIAVYKTKHMVKMAKEMIEVKVILGFVLPQKMSDFLANLKEVRVPAERVGGRFLILGGGDVAFPLLFSVSLIPSGILNSIIVAFFALLGLCVSFLLFICQKTREPIPALPPIALFSIIGYLITLII